MEHIDKNDANRERRLVAYQFKAIREQAIGGLANLVCWVLGVFFVIGGICSFINGSASLILFVKRQSFSYSVFFLQLYIDKYLCI